MPNKDGSGKGQMAAWKVSPRFNSQSTPLHRVTPCSPIFYSCNVASIEIPLTNAFVILQSGKISEEYEKRGGGYENEAGSKNEPTKGAPIPKSDAKKDAEVKENGEEKTEEKEKEKPKANSGKKATGTKKAEPKTKAPKKEKKPPAEGTRKSSRVAASAGTKRSAPEEDEDEEEEKTVKKKAPAKKAKTPAKK